MTIFFARNLQGCCHQYTRIEHKAPDNREVRRTLQNCGFSMWNVLYFTLLVPRIRRWVIHFWAKVRTQRYVTLSSNGSVHYF